MRKVYIWKGTNIGQLLLPYGFSLKEYMNISCKVLTQISKQFPTTHTHTDKYIQVREVFLLVKYSESSRP